MRQERVSAPSIGHDSLTHVQGLLPQGGLWPEGGALNRPRVQIGFSHSELLLVGVAGPELADRHRVDGSEVLTFPPAS